MKCDTCSNFLNGINRCKFCHFEDDGSDERIKEYIEGLNQEYITNSSSIERLKQELVRKVDNQPSYYNKDGLSPVDAFKQGLMSNEEYIGFCKGNIIKYIVRCQYKENPVNDLDKAMNYIRLLREVIG